MKSYHNPWNLLNVNDPSALRVLFMAPYAPDAPDYEVNPFTGDGTYPHYHLEVYQRLCRLGFVVSSTSKPYGIVHAGGAVDYVFSLYNRMPIRNSEIFVAAHCEYLGIPYLGAGPNVRAVAEDKYLSKQVAVRLQIPVPEGVPYHRGITPLDRAPFRGPYFVKDRFGAASEGISEDSLQSTWSGARAQIELLWANGKDVIVEEYAEGLDITVPVVGNRSPHILGVFHPVSDKPAQILTHDLKLTDHLGYRELDIRPPWLATDVSRIWRSLGSIDYFRLDYRLDTRTGERKFLELNVCCYIGEQGPFGLAASRDSVDFDAVLNHIVAYSLDRQDRWWKNRERIL